ncbi:MAG: hypothetical protein JWQ71_4978 [Pedosphaera sp.]|nr:hypothetical protein [Pedosphaera sp.]
MILRRLYSERLGVSFFCADAWVTQEYDAGVCNPQSPHSEGNRTMVEKKWTIRAEFCRHLNGFCYGEHNIEHRRGSILAEIW